MASVEEPMPLERKLARVHLGQERAADVFIPYYEKRDPQKGDQSIKDTYYDVAAINQIRDLAHGNHGDDDIRVILHKQKMELHKLSQERVKTWGNTIMGYRKKRLAAQDEKAKALEDERIKVDAEWAVLRAQERKEAIRRARMLQQFEEPRVKALHSQLLMSNVLYERDQQKAYKEKAKRAAQINDKTDVLKLRIRNLQAMEAEQAQAAQRVAERFAFADALRQEIAQKELNKRQASHAEEEYYSAVHAKIEQEQRQAQIEMRKLKDIKARERRQVLDAMVQEKAYRKTQEKQMLKELEKDNEKFLARKEYHALKKHEFEATLAKGRQEIFEKVSKIPVALDKEADLKRLAYIEKSSHAKDHDDEIRLAAEQAKHARQLADQREFQAERRRIVEQRRQEEREMVSQDRKEMQNKTEQYQRETREQLEKRNKVLHALSMFQEDQIKCNKKAAKEAAEAKARADAAIVATRNAENQEFDDYAESMVKEWAQMGKNVGPIRMNLEKDRPGFVRRRRGDMKRNQDTFERLGFTIRWVPGTTVNTDQDATIMGQLGK